MPTSNDEIECTVVEHFTRWLRDLHGISAIASSKRPSEPADAEIQVEGYGLVGLQLVELFWPGRHLGEQIVTNEAEQAAWLATAARRKIAKAYDRRRYANYWLLFWESMGIGLSCPRGEVRAEMSGREHAFDELWYCGIFGGDYAAVERWWPDELLARET